MRRPAVFFDRDNTLIVGSEYLGDPAKVVLVAGAAAGVAKCRSMGFAVVIVSNQSGVARGMFTEDDVQAVNKRMDQMLLEQNPAAVIDRHEYCPFHPEAKVDAYRQDSFMRKPKPGMILAASDAMALDLGRSWMVGDAPRDVAAGQAAGCRTILIVDPSLAPSPAALEPAEVEADFIVGTLVEAVELIAQHTNRKDAPSAMTPWDRESEPPPATVKPLSTSAPTTPPTTERASTVIADRIGPVAAALVSKPPAAGSSAGAPTTPAPAPVTSAPTSSAPATPPASAAATTPTPAAPAAPVRPAAASPFAVGPVAPAPAAAAAPKPATKPTPADPARTARPAAAAPAAARPVAAQRPAAATAAPANPTAAASNAAVNRLDLSRLEGVNQQMLMELKKFNDARTDDFSVSKLVAGIMQILALAVVPLGYLLHRPNDAAQLANWLLVAVFLQTFTVALLIMGRQR